MQSVQQSHCDAHKVPAEVVIFEETPSPTREELAKGLAYLRSQNATLKFGDLIEFEGNLEDCNDGIAIYDGEKIIKLATEPDDYGNLPQMFRVIEESVGADGSRKRFPIHYWHGYPGDKWHGIQKGCLVWFDHRPYMKELLQNIKYDDQLFPGQFSVYTSFKADDGETYHIVYCYQEDIFEYIEKGTWKLSNEKIDQVKQIFKTKLGSTNLIDFQCSSMDSYPITAQDNKLYLSDLTY